MLLAMNFKSKKAKKHKNVMKELFRMLNIRRFNNTQFQDISVPFI